MKLGVNIEFNMTMYLSASVWLLKCIPGVVHIRPHTIVSYYYQSSSFYTVLWGNWINNRKQILKLYKKLIFLVRNLNI